MKEIDLPIVLLICLGISTLISIGLPIGLLIYQVKKKGGDIKHFMIGVMTFVVFALILESICHQYVVLQDSPVSRMINNNKWLYILYGSLTAGIFEETGRLFAFRFMMKKTSDRSAAITYGIGHGGIESILMVGIGMVSSFILILVVYFFGFESYLEAVPAEAREATKAGIIRLSQTDGYAFLTGGIERIAAIIYHISASVFVFLAVKRNGKFFYFPFAILLHALFNIPAGLYNTGIIQSIILLEVLLFIIVLPCAYLAYRCYQKDKETSASAEAPHGY